MPHSIQHMVSVYRNIRKAVYQDATRPVNSCPTQHKANQSRLKSGVLNLCDRANIDRLNAANADQIVWEHMWKKLRYAGIKAVTASKEINDIEFYFNDYRQFLSDQWNIESKGHDLIACGNMVRDFTQRTGVFAGKLTVGNLPKLKRTVNLARNLARHMDAGGSAKDFIVGQGDLVDVWRIHQHLQENAGYGAQITTLHLLMDLGFNVVKPDIILSRLFAELGWLHARYPDMPASLSNQDITGKGVYKTKYDYTKPLMYKRIIDLANEVVLACDQQELRNDIGWVSDNPLREFDIFMVKYAQVPEQKYGLERTLYENKALVNVA